MGRGTKQSYTNKPKSRVSRQGWLKTTSGRVEARVIADWTSVRLRNVTIKCSVFVLFSSLSEPDRWRMLPGALPSPLIQMRHRVGHFCIPPVMTKSLTEQPGEDDYRRWSWVCGGGGSGAGGWGGRGLAAPYSHTIVRPKVSGGNYTVASVLVFNGWFHFLPLATAIKC